MKTVETVNSKRLWCLLSIWFFFGCGHSFFAEPKTNPVIEDKVGISGKEVLGTLATTAERRTVMAQKL